MNPETAENIRRLDDYADDHLKLEVETILARVRVAGEQAAEHLLYQVGYALAPYVATKRLDRDTALFEALEAVRENENRPWGEFPEHSEAEGHIVRKIQTGLEEGIRNTDSDGSPLVTDWEAIGQEIGGVEWEWADWLPTGMLTQICSDPGAGKSGLCLRLAACYLRGDQWPDGTAFEGEPGAVLWIETESGQCLNVDRAKKWGLPCNKILSLGDTFTDANLDGGSKHLDKVREILNRRRDIRFLIVDSLRGAHTLNENSSDTITVVKTLAGIARDFKKAVLLTHHLRKRNALEASSEIALDRVRGSTAIVQVARVVWAIDTPDPAQKERRRLSVIKSNIAAFPEPLGFTIGENGIAFREAPQTPKKEHQQDKAGEFLLVLLASGPKPATELEAKIKGARLSWDAAKRAKNRLGISSFRRGNAWFWGLEDCAKEG